MRLQHDKELHQAVMKAVAHKVHNLAKYKVYEALKILNSKSSFINFNKYSEHSIKGKIDMITEVHIPHFFLLNYYLIFLTSLSSTTHFRDFKFKRVCLKGN